MNKPVLILCAAVVFGISSLTAGSDSTLAAAPPMGWNSWNHFACKVTADDVRIAADAIASNGMKDDGYTYVNIDDYWQGARDAQVQCGKGLSAQPNAGSL